MKASIAYSLLLGACATGANADTSLSKTCCSALAAVPGLKGKVYSPGSTQYTHRLETYYSANAALAPWCMVLPECTNEVSSIAKVISKHQCPFGMRSGAHSAWRGSNGVKDGITVDFSYMNTTTYDPAKKIASVQPGSDWGHSYEALNKYGVANVGGRASVVGVGGFTTGGGYSFHSNKRGFACDTVANFEVVLADGSIVNANKDNKKDLWKALKGGSGNLGFVTRIDQHVTDSNKLWGGFVGFDLSERDAVYNSYLKFVDNMADDPASQLIVSVQWNGKERILISVLSNSDAVAKAPAFDNFLSIPQTSSTLSTGNISQLVPQFTGPTPLGLYANWMAGMTTNDIRVMKYIDDQHAIYVKKMQAAAPDSVFSVLVQFQPVTESIVKHSVANGGNVLGLEEVVADGPVLMWLIAVTVDTAANQKLINPITHAYRDAVNKYATKIGANKDWVYLNYALGDQDPISHYGKTNIDILKAASNKYDPKSVFQKLRKSGFKLPA